MFFVNSLRTFGEFREVFMKGKQPSNIIETQMDKDDYDNA